MSDWEVVPQENDSDWEVVHPNHGTAPADPEINPGMTFLSSMAPKGLTSAVYGAKEAAPEIMQGEFGKALGTYRTQRDMARDVLEKSEKQNPRAAMLGQLTPTVVSGAMGLPANIPTMGAYGGAQAALDSKADLTKLNEPGQAKKYAADIGMGVGTGGLLAGAGGYAPKSLSAVGAGAMAGELVAPGKGALPGAALGLAGRGAMSPVLRNYLSSKFNNIALNVPESASNAYLSNPESVNGSLPNDELAQKIADTLGDVKKETGPAALAAKSSLSSERVPRAGFDAQQNIGLLRSFDKENTGNLASKLERQYSELNPHTVEPQYSELTKQEFMAPPRPENQFLTEAEMHDVKAALQDAAGNWKDPLPDREMARARSASGAINEALKSGNDDYKTHMGTLSQNIQAKNGLAQKFSIQPDYSGANESGFTYTDKTIPALKDIGNSNKVDRARVLESLKNQGYGDLAGDVKNTLANSALSTGRPIGSRSVNLGTVVGGSVGTAAGYLSGNPVIGGSIGAAMGGMAGAAVDKYGGAVAKRLMDPQVMVNRLQQSPALQKFIAPIQSAAQRGNLAITVYLMGQTEPEFRKAMSEEPK